MYLERLVWCLVWLNNKTHRLQTEPQHLVVFRRSALLTLQSCVVVVLFFSLRRCCCAVMIPILTSGCKADRQNSPNGKHYLWLSSPFQRLGSVYCRLHSSLLYQTAWKTEEHRQRLTHLPFTLMQWKSKQKHTDSKNNGREKKCCNGRGGGAKLKSVECNAQIFLGSLVVFLLMRVTNMHLNSQLMI